jgi:choline kinase
MNAIIYAAGKGVRLGSNQPKVLLEFGGRSLLEWHVHHLASVDVRQLVVITGFQRETISEILPLLGERYGIQISEVVNRDFEEGSVLSFHVSLPYLSSATESVLLMDADVLYPAVMLRRLLDSSHPTALLLDREYSTADDDPVLVPVKNGRPIDFRKKWVGQADLVGESVGFFKIDPVDIPLLASETACRASGTQALRAESYDEVLRSLVLAGRFGYEDVTGLPWTEIDFPQDIERARREVLPLIESI